MSERIQNKETDETNGEATVSPEAAKPEKLHTDRRHSARQTMVMLVIIGLLVMVTIVSLVYYRRQTREFLQPQAEKITYERHYAFVGDRSNSFLQAVYEAAYQAGTENGAYVEFTGRELESAYTTEKLLKIAMASDVDGIILNADMNNELIEEINEAEAQGIPVVCIGTENYGSSRKTFIGISNYALGQEYGKLIAAQSNGKEQQVLILKSPDERVSSQNLVVSGMVDYINKAGLSGEFSFSSQTAGDETMFSAAESVTDVFAAEERPSILVCLDEIATTAACQAIVDANLVGDTTVFGFYMNDTIRNAISKQIISATVTVSPVLFGRNAVKCLDTYIKEGFVTEYVPIDIEVVSGDNLDAYIRSVREMDTVGEREAEDE
ncbi:MAG: substrate-binding domain-containing protein [Eubacteriales bacterium]|nr:substrate-binding domain-containing protein [Eubacteriales bacterium]